jgi:putative transposase
MLHRHARLDFAASLHFVTTVTGVRGNWFTERSVCEAVLRAFETCRNKYGLECLGYVLMPDHLHALLFQPNDDSAVSGCMGDFKKYVSRFHTPADYPDPPLWRRYFDDVPVPGPEAARAKIEYMHANPVRRQLVTLAEDYLWSSAKDYAETGTGIVTLVQYS